MLFSDIPGHDDAKRRLKDMAASRRVPHAILLHGPAGVGKFLLARTFAQLLHCESPTPEGEPCGKCKACRLHLGFNHLDTIYSFPNLKKENDKEGPTSDDHIEEFRKFLNDDPWMDAEAWAQTFTKKNAHPIIYVSESNYLLRRLSTSGHGDGYKIVLIWLPERMNADAANKMLKIIEEPLDNTIFIMSCDNPELMLPTILSRCQQIEVSRLSDECLADWIRTTYSDAAAEADSIAHISEGIPGAAVRLIAGEGDKGGSMQDEYFDLFVRLMRLAYSRDVVALRAWAEEVTGMGRESNIAFLTYCQRLIRENFIYNFRNPAISYLKPAEADFAQRFSPFVNEGSAPEIMEHLNKALIDVAGNTAGSFVFFDLAIKLILSFVNNKPQ